MATRNILVIKHGAFGDFVQALGAMRAIRLAHKDLRIILLTTKPFVTLGEASKYFDAVVIDPRPRWYQVFKWMVLKRFLNEGKFLRVYDLQNSERTGLYLSLFKRIPEWNGVAFSASHRVADDAARKSMHVFNALRAQLTVAGIHKVTHDELAWIKADITQFDVPQKFVLIAAGSSPQHSQKRWPADRYSEVCRWLVERGFTPVLLGTNDEAQVNASIASVCPQAIDLTGRTTLFQIAVLARAASAAVGNDTGPIQMIGPTGCRTLGLYPGFSNPVRHGPLGANVKTLQGQTMADISVNAVKDALSPFLNEAAAA